MMPALFVIYDRLAWAVLTGTLVLAVVAILCRIKVVDPAIKVWCCRLAAVKMPLGLFAVGIAIPTSQKPSVFSSSQWENLILIYILAIWITGAMWVVWDLVKAARQLRTLVHPDRDDETVINLKNSALRYGVKNRFQICSSDAINHPYLVDGILPKLYVHANTSAFAFAHELAHLKHGDLHWMRFIHLTRILFWFHPLVHRLEREHRLWQEVRADRFAMLMTGAQPQVSASEILKAVQPVTSSVLGMSSDAKDCETRIRHLYSYRYSRPLTFIACALILVMCIPFVRTLAAPDEVFELRSRSTAETAKFVSEPLFATKI